jgi:hypothetical protein
MSAASTPAPRAKSPTDTRTTPSRHTLFLPMLIFLLGAGSLALYQVMTLEDRWDEVTQTIDKLDPQVKRGQYEKAKFYAIAREVLRLAPKDPNADQVAVYFKLRQLQEAQPELMSLNTATDAATDTSTNALPAPPTVLTNATSAVTNAAPTQTPVPAAR